MGKHEIIAKTVDAAALAEHRAVLRALGKRLGVPDINDPAIREQIRLANEAIAANPQAEEEVMAWIEAMCAGGPQSEPDYEW